MELTMLIEKLKELFQQYYHEEPLRLVPLPVSASGRRYFRIESESQTAIGAYNDNIIENEAFFYLTKQLQFVGVIVPELYSISMDKCLYLLEDLGNTTLYQQVLDLTHKDDWQRVEQVYRQVIDAMPAIQYKSAQNLDFSICYPRAAFDRQSIAWDLQYFKYLFLKVAHVNFDEQKLEDDFQTLTDFLLQAPADFFLFRDFQSRNIMIHQGKPCFIDYQGGRKGALQYDLASLLFEGKVNLPYAMRHRLLEYYVEVFNQYDFFRKDEFLHYFPAYALIRLLQAFGAYGYRGLVEQMSFFAQSIPHGHENIRYLLSHYELNCEIPYLKQLLLQADFTIEGLDQRTCENNMLTIKVLSFSYKKGLPVDYSGHGGGYLFDARSLPNPGRLDRYRNLTGESDEVAHYLQEMPETQNYYQSVRGLVLPAVETYLKRQFTYLSIGFGCTGGQHRSVFLAKKTALELSKNYPVRVILAHRELNKEYTYEQDSLQT